MVSDFDEAMTDGLKILCAQVTALLKLGSRVAALDGCSGSASDDAAAALTRASNNVSCQPAAEDQMNLDRTGGTDGATRADDAHADDARTDVSPRGYGGASVAASLSAAAFDSALPAVESGIFLQGDVAMCVFAFLDHAPCLHRALGGSGGGGAAALWRVSSAARAYFGSEAFTQQLAAATQTLVVAANLALYTARWNDATINAALTHRCQSVRRLRPPPRAHPRAAHARGIVCAQGNSRLHTTTNVDVARALINLGAPLEALNLVRAAAAARAAAPRSESAARACRAPPFSPTVTLLTAAGCPRVALLTAVGAPVRVSAGPPDAADYGDGAEPGRGRQASDRPRGEDRSP